MTLGELHDHELASLVGADVEDRDDVRMIEGAGGPRLQLEALHATTVARQFPRNDFHGDLPAEARVTSSIDLPHTAGSEQRQQLVASELRAWPERHGTHSTGCKRFQTNAVPSPSATLARVPEFEEHVRF